MLGLNSIMFFNFWLLWNHSGNQNCPTFSSLGVKYWRYKPKYLFNWRSIFKKWRMDASFKNQLRNLYKIIHKNILYQNSIKIFSVWHLVSTVPSGGFSDTTSSRWWMIFLFNIPAKAFSRKLIRDRIMIRRVLIISPPISCVTVYVCNCFRECINKNHLQCGRTQQLAHQGLVALNPNENKQTNMCVLVLQRRMTHFQLPLFDRKLWFFIMNFMTFPSKKQ